MHEAGDTTPIVEHEGVRARVATSSTLPGGDGSSTARITTSNTAWWRQARLYHQHKHFRVELMVEVQTRHLKGFSFLHGKRLTRPCLRVGKEVLRTMMEMMKVLMLKGVTHMWPIFTSGAAALLMKDPGLEMHRPHQDALNLTNLTMLAVPRHHIRKIRSYDFQENENDIGSFHPMQLTLAWASA